MNSRNFFDYLIYFKAGFSITIYMKVHMKCPFEDVREYKAAAAARGACVGPAGPGRNAGPRSDGGTQGRAAVSRQGAAATLDGRVGLGIYPLRTSHTTFDCQYTICSFVHNLMSRLASFPFA